MTECETAFATQVGYLLPSRDRLAAGDPDPRPLLALAQQAEAQGFDSVWAGDSPLARPRADPLTLLAAVAARTERVTLGTAVLLAALRHPILLAQQLATLDRLADGRLVVGVGAGFDQPATAAQCAALGVDHQRRSAALGEAIVAMRRLWSGSGASFHGTHFRFDDVTIAPTPAQEGGPPVWMAGGGRGLAKVAAHADGWLPYPPTAQQYADEWNALRQSAVVDHGRRTALTPAFYATVCLDDDADRARQRLKVSIERYYRAPLEHVRRIQAVFAGSPGDCLEWLEGYRRAGARHVVVRLAADDQGAALDEFAASVLAPLTASAPERSRS